MSLQSFSLVLERVNMPILSMSDVFNKWKSQCWLHNHGVLSSSCGRDERQSWTVEQNQSCSNSNRYWRRSHKELKSARLCRNNVNFVTPVHLLSCFGILAFCLVEFNASDSPCSIYTLFRLISIARHVFKSLSIGVQGTKFEIYCEHVSK